MRAAIFFAPPPQHPLTRAAALWLGRDPYSGEEFSQTATDRFTRREIRELTTSPRRYGFHATLKAPFRLAGDLAALDAATAAVAAGCQSFQLRLHVGALGPFLALLPDAPPAELHAVEAACVTGLDAFRAPPDPSELERRRAAGLDPVEEENLRRWGYPYVLDRFRFHLTLTGPLPEATRTPLQEALTTALAPSLAAPVPVTDICRFSDADDGVFRLVRRFPLG